LQFLLRCLALDGIGGLWLWVFIRQLRRSPLLPVGDPFIEEALRGGE
jgi:hypothetical protein